MNKDLMDWLYTAFIQDALDRKETLSDEGRAATAAFVDWARKKLQENPPTGVFMATHGIGLKLADASEVPVLPQPQDVHLNAWMPVTRPVMHPQGDTVYTPTLPIFGGGK